MTHVYAAMHGRSFVGNIFESLIINFKYFLTIIHELIYLLRKFIQNNDIDILLIY